MRPYFFSGLVHFLFLPLLLWAQPDLENGNREFFLNRRREAREAYQREVAANGAGRAEALLMLSLISTLEGKEEEAFAHFSTFFKTAPDPYPYLYALWGTESVTSATRMSEERLRFLESLLTDPRANGTIRAMAASAIGDYYFSSARLDKSLPYYARIGSVDAWSMAGEFENISESGFDKNFDPITRPGPDAVFANKNGAPVRWFTMRGNRFDRWVDFTYHYFAEDAILYAQSFVESPSARDVVLRIGTSGSVKVWVNDVLCIREAEERNNDLDTYQAPVRLEAGTNRILVQVGSSEINRSNFMVRLTGEDGQPVPGLKSSAEWKPYPKGKPGPLPALIPIFAESFFSKRIASGNPSVVDYLMLAQTCLRNDKGYEARKALAGAEKRAPDFSYLKIKLMEAHNRSGNETDAKILVEWLKVKDPDLLLSLNLAFNEAIEKEAYEEATLITDRAARLYGESEDILLKRITLAALEKKQTEMVNRVLDAYRRYPDLYTFAELLSDVEKDINKDFQAAIRIHRKYLKTHYSYEAAKALSDLYFGNGMAAEGVRAYEEILVYSPHSTRLRYNLARYLAGSQQHSKALAHYQTCIDNAPDVYYLHSAAADALKESGNTAGALKAYQRALELNPGDFESREAIRKLSKKPDVFSWFPRSDVYEIARRSPGPSEYPGDHSLILHDEVQKVVYQGGTSEERKVFLVKILNSEGIDRWKQYYVDHSSMQSVSIEKAEVIKAGGSRIEGEINNDEIVFTGLEAGDAIHVTCRLKSSNSGKMASHFWDSFYFSHFLPYLTTRYSLLAENGVSFRHVFSRENIEPRVETRDEFRLWTWEKTRQPSLDYEDRMPELQDVGNILFISSIPDWTFVSNWYHDLAASKQKPGLEVKEAVSRLLEGRTGLGEMEKARLIYEYIVTNIKYLSVSFLQSGLIPQRAAHTLNTRLGDCKDVSTLFVAMCREAGLDAGLVLVATRNNGKNQMPLPGIDFNHCIARLISGGRSYYIELTSDKLPFNSFYDNLLNANSLHIFSEASGEKAELIYLNPPTRNPNTVRRLAEIRMEGNDVYVRKTAVKTGVFASVMRDGYRDLGEPDQLKEMQRAIAGDYSQTILKNLEFTGLEGVGDSVRYSFEFFAPEAVSELGGLRVLALPWSEKASSGDFNFTGDRRYPIDLWNVESDGEEEEIGVVLPEGLDLADKPADVRLSCPVADYSLTCQQVGNRVLARRKLRYKKDAISLEDMKEFEVFYRKVVASDNRQVAFRKIAGSPAGKGRRTPAAKP